MKYKKRVEQNVGSLLTDPTKKKKLEVLRSIVKRFEDEGVRWCLTCSFTLFLRGIQEDFNDFDILIDWRDISTAVGIMKEMRANNLPKGDQSEFSSTLFNKYEIEDVKIDLFSEWRTNSDFTFEYAWQADDCEEITVDGVALKIISIKTQILFYSTFLKTQPHRARKLAACIDYFLESM